MDRLADLILLIDFSKSPYDDPVKGSNYCAKNVAVLNIAHFNFQLLGYSTMLPLAEKTLKVALHHGFPDMILFSARFCMNYYFGIQQVKKANQYKELVDLHLEILKDEFELEFENQVYRSKEIITQKKPNSEEIIYGIERAEAAKKIMAKYKNNTRIHINGTFVLFDIYRYLALHEELVNTCRHSIQMIKEDSSRFTLPFINITYGTCLRKLIKLGGYEEAFQLYDERAAYFEEGSRNWFSLHLYYSILNIHAGRYQVTFDLYKTIMVHKKFFKQTKTMQEQWVIFEGYMQILIKAGMIPDSTGAPEYKVSKIDKKVKILRKDTGGYGLSVRVVKIMHGLLDKDYSALLDQEEALQVYMNRYLKNDFTYRISCLLKMLITIIRCNFHPVRSEAHIKDKKLFSKLKKVPFKDAYQPDDLEIIPLEILWKIALESL
jgi:hypothetical protein